METKDRFLSKEYSIRRIIEALMDLWEEGYRTLDEEEFKDLIRKVGRL